MPARIDEAQEAIAIRFCAPGRIDDDELKALADAQNALETLKAERGKGAVLKPGPRPAVLPTVNRSQAGFYDCGVARDTGAGATISDARVPSRR